MSYTPEETASIVEEYNANPGREAVEAIAARIGKSPRSVIAKLAATGVYQTPQRTTKTGDPIIKKEEMVRDIEECLDISVPTLVKAGKQDLAKLVKAIKESLVNDEDA
jgi:hypothetical protein